MGILIGNEIPQAIDNSTQVYKATHEGTERLSLRDRSFISFSYGEKSIEDFNFIATIQNSRIQKDSSAAFEALTSSYEVLDGQFYWGSHFTTNTLAFSLATDEITEVQLAEFKHYFQPGKIRELVLAENPNRALWARLDSPVVFSLLPFEKKITQKIAGTIYETSTTAYRGEATITFIADKPFWHSRASYIKPYYTDKEDKIGSMADTGTYATLDDKDFIKIIHEDGIPYSTMRDNTIIFGDTQEGKTLSDAANQYLYYCGTAPARPTLQFSLKPRFDNDRLSYPLNSYSKVALQSEDVNSYNTICIGNKEMRFTAPALYLGYNQAIDLMDNMKQGESYDDARAALRDGVNEYYARSWSIYCLEGLKANSLGINSETGEITNKKTFFYNFSSAMRYFLTETGSDSPGLEATFTINSQTGEGRGKLQFRIANIGDATFTALSQLAGKDIFIVEENIEDMVRSNYLVIDDRTLPNEDGQITKDECLEVTTDFPADYGGLTNVIISYQNLYL